MTKPRRTRESGRRSLDRREFLGLLAAGGAGAFLAACSPSAPAAPPTAAAPAGAGAKPAATAAPSTGAGAAKPHGRLVIGGNVPREMAPTSMLANYDYGNPVFDGLTWPNWEGKLEPRLATSWKVLDDKVTWEFQLRKGVTFDNGEPFNAESVKYSVEKVLKEKTRWYGRIATIKEAKPVDETTIRIVTNAPDPLLPGRMMFFMMPPKGVEAAGGLDNFGKKPSGTGSYSVESFVPEQRLLLKYRPGSWREGVVGVPDKPLEVEFVHMPDPAARMAALRSGGIDVAMNIPFDELKKLEGEGFRITAAAEASPTIAFIDTFSDTPFKDKRVRQAINYAVDKKTIREKLYLGYVGDLPGQLVCSDGFGYNPDITEYPYDPAKAKQLLADAGYPNGFSTKVEVYSKNISAGETTAEALADYFSKVGIKLEIVSLEGGVWLQKWYGGGRAPLFLGWANYLPLYDADFSYNWFWSKNQPEGARFMKNERFDTLFEAQRKELDSDKRLGMLKEMASIVHDEAAVLYLFRQGRAHAASAKVKGLVATSDQMFYVDFASVDK